MSVLSGDRWQVVSPYLDRALEMAGDERTAWLEWLRTEDPALAADLEALLKERSALSREGFLEGAAPQPPAPASLAGQTMGAYTLISLIGQGGMGNVWLARRSDGRFEGQAAVKLLNASLAGRAGEGRFRREGSILARLNHPHIAPVSRTRACHRPASPISCWSTSKESRSTATATGRVSASRDAYDCSSMCSMPSPMLTPI